MTPFSQKGYAGLTVRDAVNMGYQMIFFSSTIFFKAVKAALEAATKLVQTGDPKQLWPDEYWEKEFLDLVELPKWIERSA